MFASLSPVAKNRLFGQAIMIWRAEELKWLPIIAPAHRALPHTDAEGLRTMYWILFDSTKQHPTPPSILYTLSILENPIYLDNYKQYLEEQ